MTPSADTADMIDSTLQNEPTLRKDAKEPIEPTEKAELIEPMLMNEFLEPMLNAEFFEAMLHRELIAISASVMSLLCPNVASPHHAPHRGKWKDEGK